MPVEGACSVILSVAASAVLIVGLSGCSAVNETPSPTSSATSSTSGSSETAIPDEEAEEEPDSFPFVLPTTCSEVVGPELEAKLLSDGMLFLLGSNGTGLYAGEFFSSNQNVGSPLTCVYGPENSDNYIEFDVQGLTPDVYQAALEELTRLEFTESEDGDVKTFALVGAVEIVDAKVHVLRPDSWITVVNQQGGTSAFDEANEWLETVTSHVHPEP